MPDATIQAVDTPVSPVTDNKTQPLADPKTSDTLALGAAETTTPAPASTMLESGMVVITTPQGKAGVDKNAPASVTDAFVIAAAPSGIVPVYSEDNKRIIGGANGSKESGKGKLVVTQSMITTESGKSYTFGQYVDPKELSSADKDVLTSGDVPALLPCGE